MEKIKIFKNKGGSISKLINRIEPLNISSLDDQIYDLQTIKNMELNSPGTISSKFLNSDEKINLTYKNSSIYDLYFFLKEALFILEEKVYENDHYGSINLDRIVEYLSQTLLLKIGTIKKEDDDAHEVFTEYINTIIPELQDIEIEKKKENQLINLKKGISDADAILLKKEIKEANRALDSINEDIKRINNLQYIKKEREEKVKKKIYDVKKNINTIAKYFIYTFEDKYKGKYLKYKEKYLNLKKQLNGASDEEDLKETYDEAINYYYSDRKKIVSDFERKISYEDAIKIFEENYQILENILEEYNLFEFDFNKKRLEILLKLAKNIFFATQQIIINFDMDDENKRKEVSEVFQELGNIRNKINQMEKDKTTFNKNFKYVKDNISKLKKEVLDLKRLKIEKDYQKIDSSKKLDRLNNDEKTLNKKYHNIISNIRNLARVFVF